LVLFKVRGGTVCVIPECLEEIPYESWSKTHKEAFGSILRDQLFKVCRYLNERTGLGTNRLKSLRKEHSMITQDSQRVQNQRRYLGNFKLCEFRHDDLFLAKNTFD